MDIRYDDRYQLRLAVDYIPFLTLVRVTGIYQPRSFVEYCMINPRPDFLPDLPFPTTHADPQTNIRSYIGRFAALAGLP